ncbi:MAG TPA: DUF111 family protein [Methanocorpusculum sp.]|nr:DUF111 family protein [Methanocorpusculum sp.]HJJ50054.1 DUF111 family protein [Methanocorpusculum sp.]
MRTLIVDPRIGGISGAAFATALSDLGGFEKLEKHIVDILRKWKGEDPEVVMDELGLSDLAKHKLRSVISDLRSAHTKFHEGDFSLAEKLQDIISPIALLDGMGLLSCPIYATPPALGTYLPETLGICALHKIPFSNSQAITELTTPEGVALLGNLAVFRRSIPSMTPLKTGYAKDHGLMLIEGEVSDLTEERVIILETNIDDVSGEIIGYAVERLLASGAVDVFVTQGFGKKHRPVFVLSVITTLDQHQKLVEVLMEETGTLGVRIREEPRIVAGRIRRSYTFIISGQEFSVRVKVSKHCGRVISVKPEFEDMKQAAQKLNIPLKDVVAEVQSQIPTLVNG